MASLGGVVGDGQEPGGEPPHPVVARTFDRDPESSLLVRTDFTDDAAWEAVVAEATRPYGPESFSASLTPVSDTAFDGMGPVALAAIDGTASVVFAADADSMADSDRTVVVVDRVEQPGRSFRVVMAHLWGVENNLRLANMDLADFLLMLDGDGVFRGFPIRRTR
jgi:hypothetical protein